MFFKSSPDVIYRICDHGGFDIFAMQNMVGWVVIHHEMYVAGDFGPSLTHHSPRGALKSQSHFESEKL
jgi:hypothetical protein